MHGDNGSIKFISLFLVHHPLTQFYYLITQIPLLDPLPQQICSACFGKCNEWREFETLSKSTNHRLQREIVIEIPEASWDSDYKEKRPEEKIPVVVLERLEEVIAKDQSTTVIVIVCPICRVDLPDLPVSVRQHLKGHVSEMVSVFNF